MVLTSIKDAIIHIAKVREFGSNKPIKAFINQKYITQEMLNWISSLDNNKFKNVTITPLIGYDRKSKTEYVRGIMVEG